MTIVIKGRPISKGLYSKRKLNNKIKLHQRRMKRLYRDMELLVGEHEADWGENNMCKHCNYLWLLVIVGLLVLIWSI